MESSTLRRPGPDDRRPLAAQLPVRPDAIARARTTVQRAAAQAGMHPDRIDDLVIAVSEACTNAMEAQVRAGVESPIELSCALAGRTFEVVVRDRGGGFAPGVPATRPPLSDPRHLDVERGWGIQLMRALVDELVFELSGAGTAVRLRIAL